MSREVTIDMSAKRINVVLQDPSWHATLGMLVSLMPAGGMVDAAPVTVQTIAPSSAFSETFSENF